MSGEAASNRVNPTRAITSRSRCTATTRSIDFIHGASHFSRGMARAKKFPSGTIVAHLFLAGHQGFQLSLLDRLRLAQHRPAAGEDLVENLFVRQSRPGRP